MRRLIVLLCGLVLTGCGLLFSSQGSTITIAPGEVGVLVNTFNGDIIGTLQPGRHNLLPDNAVTIYSTLPQSYTMSDAVLGGTPAAADSVEARTSDGQPVHIDITLVYRIDANNVITLHQRWGDRYADNFIRPQTRSGVRDTAATFTSEEFYGEGRVTASNQLRPVLAERFLAEGLLLDDLAIRNITFSQAFEDAIAAQAIATMETERLQQDLRATQTRSALTGQLLDNDLAARVATLEAENASLRATLIIVQGTATPTPRP